MYKHCHCVYTMCPTYTKDHLTIWQLNKGAICMQTPHVLGSLGIKARSPLGHWEWAISLTNEMEMYQDPWHPSIAITCTPAVAFHVAVYTEGISDQQINSGLSELSTEQKSQLQRNGQHSGISPSCGLSDLHIARGNCSKVEELLHWKEIGFLNAFHFSPEG